MSIKKIAEKTGVSTATVSRVLNNPNYRCSSPELRDKIWKTAIELNYTPNAAARSLKKGETLGMEKTYYIHVLVTRMNDSQSDPFFRELLRVIESEIHNQACILSKVWYQSLFSKDKKCRTGNLDCVIDEMYDGKSGKCDGLIVLGKCNKLAVEKLNRRYKNVVLVNRNAADCEVDEILCDGEKIAAAAVEHLIALGHKEIGYVGSCYHEARYRGFLRGLQEHAIEPEEDYIIETKQTEAEGYDAMLRFLQSDNAPTGIYCANDITAVGMLKCLNKYKNSYYTPSIIASDDIEEAQYTKPMLTTVRLPKEEMGKFAMYLLLDRLRGGHKGAVHMELEGKLMVRESCTQADESRWCDYYI